jgi:hypothetical protein
VAGLFGSYSLIFSKGCAEIAPARVLSKNCADRTMNAGQKSRFRLAVTLSEVLVLLNAVHFPGVPPDASVAHLPRLLMAIAGNTSSVSSTNSTMASHISSDARLHLRSLSVARATLLRADNFSAPSSDRLGTGLS